MLNKKELQSKAKELRKEIIKMIFAAESGHPWWSLSAIDLMTVLFYWWYLKFDVNNSKWENRDYFVLSKWHISPAYYSILSDLWYFSKDELFSFRQIDSLLQWHPNNKIPWVEVATWSLWQWLSIANWIALWLKIDNKENKVWALLWDWELQEWQVWEAVMTSNHNKLGNLVAIVDHNWIQIDGKLEEVKSVWDVAAKFRAFDWEVFEIDGHNFDEIIDTYKKAIAVKDKPTCIVAKTTKWKWISFMEWKAWWHGKAPSEEQFNQAIEELN